jgi:predicted small secreted protein
LRRSVAALLALAGLALTLTACNGTAHDPQDAGPPVIGLVTSLPIVWDESVDIAAMLASDAPPHWALGVLREAGDLRPLDTLADAKGNLPLPPGALLVLAQPYPLPPQDNVALDKWVREGGRVLFFADPMLTFESDFALGDRRRPQDIALLSPILARWGLELRFDEDQPPGERQVDLEGMPLPVNLPGQFALREDQGSCDLGAGGLAVNCRIGAGRVLAIADAALLEPREDDPRAIRSKALSALLDRLLR